MKGTRPVRAEPAAVTEAAAATGPQPKGPRWLLPAGALLLAAVLAAYLADLVTHLSYMAAMRDLVVYRDGGLIVRHSSPAYDPHHGSPLYDWTGQNGVQFTYPPFAAVIFAVASVLSWTAMRWAMTLASLAALGLSLWLVFGALGYRDRPAIRLGATLGVSALALATEPVQQTLALGQVNLLLMLLVVADLLTGGALTPGGSKGRTRWWHGVGIGIAAGVKLTPLIFIPYLLLIRRYRQAATAAGVFAATVALGYAILPRDSGTYWAHGLFLKANRIVFLGTRGNQSLRGVLTRLAGSVSAGTACKCGPGTAPGWPGWPAWPPWPWRRFWAWPAGTPGNAGRDRRHVADRAAGAPCRRGPADQRDPRRADRRGPARCATAPVHAAPA